MIRVFESRVGSGHWGKTTPDLVATMAGQDSGLLAMKLGRQLRGFYVPVDKP